MAIKLDKSLNTDMGHQLAKIEKAINDLDGQALSGLDVSDLEVTAADATDDTTVWALANELKANFNTLVDRIAALQP